MATSPATASMPEVSAARLRRLALARQGLMTKAPFGRGSNATLAAIQRLGYVQIDTISVVARAHDHVLYNRVPNYAAKHPDGLLSRGVIFEYWYHAAAYLPMRDYRFALPHMQRMRDGSERWIRSRDQALMARVLDRVRAEGPLMARDFETPARGGAGWWNWKPTKRALEQLFMQGDLMAAGRRGFQKIYDLTERALPPGTDTRMPDVREMAEYLLRTSIRAQGFATQKFITYSRRGSDLRQALKEVLTERLSAGELVAIREPSGSLAYADPELLASRTPAAPARALLLSPFDNLVIQRDRVQSVFEFDYQLECYLKEKDRRFGYFCLPILYRDILAGRADCKAHRGTGHFQIRHLHLEREPALPDEEFLPGLAAAVRRFAAFHDCERVSVDGVSPLRVAKDVRRAFSMEA